jgi:hypothetical protein
MAERRGGLRFALESLHHAFARHQLRQHGLDGDLAVQRKVQPEIHGSHATATELAVDVVFAERGFAEHRAQGIDAGICFDRDGAAECRITCRPHAGYVIAAARAELRALCD